MKIPRNLGGRELAKYLGKLGYRGTRQSGNHIRLTTLDHGEHHITVPDHRPLKTGTLAHILANVAAHFEISRDDLVERLFG